MSATVPSAPELARFSLPCQHGFTRRWVDDQARLANLAQAYEFDVRLATDLELAAQRAQRMDVGHPADAFLNRWTTVSADLQAMFSIRFEGLDPDKPFVDATVLSRRFTADDLPALARVGHEGYGRFEPRYLRLWSAAQADAHPGTDRDRRFLAAPLADLAARQHLPAGLTLAPAKDLSRYEDAVAAYASVDETHRDHPAQASIQPAGDLAESIEAGTLFDVLVDGEWAGYVGATRDGGADMGMDAYVVQEIILGPAYRGRRYGSHLTTLLAQRLPDRHRVLVGTIHADNRGALNAALDAGRYDVGGWVQVPYRSAGDAQGPRTRSR